MNLTTKLMGMALALVIVASPAIAQQGEGTGGDFNLNTQRNADASTQDDKFLCVGDGITINFSSSSLNGGVAAFGDIAPVSVDILESAGLGLGLGTGVNRFGLFDGISDPLGPAMVGGNLSLSFGVPASQDWIDGGAFANNPDAGLIVADDWGFFVQGVTLDPTGPFGVQVSNTIKHEVGNELGDGFSDNCADALMCDGLTDADLGVSQLVDTSLYQNDVVTDWATLATTTTFSVAPAGTVGFIQADSNDAFVTFTTATGGVFNFSLCNSSYDTSLFILDTDCVTGLIANDDNNAVCGAGFRSDIESFMMTAGQTVVVGVDGYQDGNNGLAELIITKLPDFNVTSLDLSIGDIAGGEVVTLTGTGLNVLTDVTFGGVSGTSLTIIDAMTATVVAPAGAAGAVDVVVTDGVDTQTFVGGWTYVDNSGPSFSECSMPAIAFGGEFGTPVTIQDTLTVAAGAGASIAAGTLNVDMDITHPWRGDIRMDLTSPAGTILRLRDGTGAGDDDIIGNFPVDFAVDGGAPSSGLNQDLSDFDAEDPNGTWTLDIEDRFPATDDGVLNMWCVNGGLEFASVAAANMPGIAFGGEFGTPVTIQDTLVVAADTTIGSINVDMDITHPWRGDIRMDLTSPAGTILRLRDGTGAGDDDIIGNFPTDFAADGGAPSTGAMQDLSDFEGEATAGNWILDIEDRFPATDDGVLNAWGINVN